MSYKSAIKPIFDKLMASCIIIAFSPIWLLGLVYIYIVQEGSLFYKQSRSGKGLKSFNLYKIRTLEDSNSNDLALSNRTFTKLGKWLRKLSIDELPQLYNVLKGDMSLVGPRPLPVLYENRYSAAQKKRFNCKPGITGWAQINGGNNISWEDRFELDIWYIDHISFFFDLKIIFLTGIKIFDKNHHTEMPVFAGSKIS